MNSSLIDEIIRIKDIVPKKQKALCSYLAINYEQVSMMTVAELSKAAGVGTTTVMRFIKICGYSSFTDFKHALINATLIQNAAPYQGLKQSFISDAKTESSDTFRSVVTDGILVLESLFTPSNITAFESAVKLMMQAGSIYTLGLRSSRALSLYFDFLVDRFLPCVRQLSDEGEFIFDKVSSHIRPADVLLVFSVYPCTKKTIDVSKLCHKLCIPIILITNTRLNPLAKIADVMIETNSVNHASGDTALFAIVEALAAELGRRTSPSSTKLIERIERIITDNNLILWED